MVSLLEIFFEAAHLKNHRFDEDHRQKIENYLQTEVRIPLQEETLNIRQDAFTIIELEKALKIVESSSFDNDLILPKILQNWGPNNKYRQISRCN